MEPQDREGHEGGKESGEPRGPRVAGPEVVGTDDPTVMPGAAGHPDWIGQPDQTTAIETSRIRGPSEAFHPNFVMVPVEVDRPRNGRSNRGQDGDDRGGKGRRDEDAGARKGGSDPGQDDAQDPGKSEGRGKGVKSDKSSRGPSPIRGLILSGVVALVCGVAGAWCYSYFLGSSSSGHEKSSGRGADSGKSAGSGKSSGSDGGSDSGQGSGPETSRSDEGQGKVRQAESAWMMAVKELHAAQASEKAARRSEEETRSILTFLKKTLMSASRPVDAPLSEAFWAGGPNKDVSFRKAVDVTESQVAETFGERPLAEATVREMLGLAYLALGDPAQAVKQYERAFALRQAMQGVNDPETAACRNQLAVAYRLAGRTAEGGRLFDRDPNSTAYASSLAVGGSMLLAQKHPVDAELKLRECLTIRQKIQPEEWTTFETRSLLGEALLDQDRFADAEPFLVSGFEGMKRRAGTIPPQGRPRLKKALERLVRLYESWGKEAEVTRWRKELDAAHS